MKREFRMKAAALAIAVGGLFGAALAEAQSANEIFVPVLVYRTGPYAPNGIPWADGFVDYLKLVNARDGGVNGVKIAFEECETGYATDRGVECYERLKSKHPVAFSPLSTGITYALTDKVYNDHIVLITAGYGRADSVDGAVFKWNFPMMGTYWDGADILVQHVKKKGSLKGKKIALVYHDSPYGKEPIPVLEELAKKEGFELIKLPVTHPGVEQKATWLQIRQQRPDYVFLWGWGVMNSTAIKEAIAVGYPRLQMYGVWWAAAEPDVLPAEMAAKGYNGGEQPADPQGHDQVPLRQGAGHRRQAGGGGAGPLQPGHALGDAHCRVDPRGAGQVRQARRHGRGSALGRRASHPRQGAHQGAGRRGDHAADAHLLHGPRRVA